MSKKQGTEHPLDKLMAAKTTDELMEYMQEEDEASEREQILQEMSPAFQTKLKYFEEWLRNETLHTLRSRYALGKQALELYLDETNNGAKVYGCGAIDRICKILRWDDGVIRLCLRFVQTYSQEDLERLCALVLPSGAPLTWSHVRTLFPVADANRRQELLDKTVAEGWTCMQLGQEVKFVVHGDRDKPLPRIPNGFDDAVAQQQKSAEQWDRLYSSVWNKPTRSLAIHAAKLDPDQVTEERLRDARDLAIQLRRVADQAKDQADKAEQVVREFEQILESSKGAKATKKSSQRKAS